MSNLLTGLDEIEYYWDAICKESFHIFYCLQSGLVGYSSQACFW